MTVATSLRSIALSNSHGWTARFAAGLAGRATVAASLRAVSAEEPESVRTVGGGGSGSPLAFACSNAASTNACRRARFAARTASASSTDSGGSRSISTSALSSGRCGTARGERASSDNSSQQRFACSTQLND